MSEFNGRRPPSARRAGPQFHAGDEVEVTCSEPGFDGVWFEAEVLGPGKWRGTVQVRYNHLVHDDDHSRFLEETFNVHYMRPARRAPAEPEQLRPGDAVEAFVNDGWWAGEVAESTCAGSVYVVSFPDNGLLAVPASNIRRRLDWVNGKWVAPPPSSTPEKQITRNLVAATTIASELTWETRRKRGRPPKKSGKSKGKVSSPMKGEQEKVIRDSKSSRYFSMHGCSDKPSHKANMPNLPSDQTDQSNPELATRKELTIQPWMKNSFGKMTSLWNEILSKDIFRAMPEPPHFRPFEQLPEHLREKNALCLMINFKNLANFISTLNPDDVSIPGLVHECLDDFECHGFDVENLKIRLKDLAQVKKTLEEISLEQARSEAELALMCKGSSELASKINEMDQNMNELYKNLNELEGKILFLNRSRAEVVDAEKKCETMKFILQMKIQTLQKKADEMKIVLGKTE